MVGSIILSIWPIIVIVLFLRVSKPKALLISIIAGYLILPTKLSMDLPLIPKLDKDSIPAISAFVMLLFIGSRDDRGMLPGWFLRGVLPNILVLGLLVGAFFTVLTNGDPLSYGQTDLPALRPFDAFSTILSLLTVMLPFFLGRKLLAHPENQRLILVSLVVAGVIYSLPTLYEIRMSPQLNLAVYGFFPHDWIMHIRGDGFRPIVFLHHGLWLSIFFAMTILAAFGLRSEQQNSRKRLYLGAGMWLLIILAMSRSLGAQTIALALLPMILFLARRGQLTAAAVLSGIVLIYPLLRGADLVPVDRVLEWAGGVSEDRAGSLAFRLANENILLEKAQERPLFGWGGWGRNFVFDERGRSISTTDGYWIIIIGVGGWVRYLAEFGLLCLPAFVAAIRARHYSLGPETSVLLLLLTANLLDLIPNATITPITWLIAGAIWGRLELQNVTEPVTSGNPKEDVSQRQLLGYSRFKPVKRNRTPS